MLGMRSPPTMRFLSDGMTEMIHAELGPDLEAIVLDLIETGKYSSRTQVLRDSEELKDWREAQLRAFDASVDRAVADIKAGKGIPLDEVFETLRAEFPLLRHRDE